MAFLAEPINGEPEQTLLILGEMIDTQARRAIETQELGRLEPDLAIDHQIVLADQDRIAKAKSADRSGDFAHMGGIEGADFSRR